MQTQVLVARRLEFLKQVATDPVPYQTNQMYLVVVSNIFGVEAWNSYRSTYPRDLQMIVVADMTEGITNEWGQCVPLQTQTSSTLSNRFTSNNGANGLSVPANTWTGFDDINWATYIRVLLQEVLRFLQQQFLFPPLFQFLAKPERFIAPSQAGFEQGQGFYAPRWWLSLKTRLRFIMVDRRDSNRIVGLLNLSSSDEPVDITQALTDGARGGGTNQAYQPDASRGSMWITNERLAVPISSSQPLAS